MMYDVMSSLLSTPPSYSPSPTLPIVLLKDKSNFSPWNTPYAVWATRSSGSLSAVSSFVIIYIILRSKTKLSSIYHRIMFGLSAADIIGSVSMALASWPMPSHMPREEYFGYHWAGARLGNTRTCTAQGFFAIFGLTCMPTYNLMLCMYYFCAIYLNMREKKIKNKVEPFLHAFPLITGLALAFAPLPFDLYNPSMAAYAWCGPIPYPYECYMYPDEIECIRGDPEMMNMAYNIISIFSAVMICLVILILLFVIKKVIHTDRMLRKLSDEYKQRNQDATELRQTQDFHRSSKAAIVQAASYMLTTLLSNLPVFLLSSGAISVLGSEGERKIADNFEKMMLLFLPLQGFFNCIIFVSHKVYNYRRVHGNVSTCHVFGLLLFTSAHDPTFISRISIVSHHDRAAREKFQDDNGDDDDDDDEDDVDVRICDIQISDEADSQQHFRLTLIQGNGTCDEVVEQPKSNEHSPIDDSQPHSMIGSSGMEDDSMFSFPSRSTLDGAGMLSQEDSTLHNEEQSRRKYYNESTHVLKSDN